MSTDTTKTIRASSQGKAGVEITEQSAALVGNQNNFIVCNESGTYVKGPISFITDATGIRKGGLFVGLNDFLHMVPSTIISPIPTQIPFMPVGGLVNLTRDLAFFLALLV